jgi:hypothetical protein
MMPRHRFSLRFLFASMALVAVAYWLGPCPFCVAVAVVAFWSVVILLDALNRASLPKD